MSILQAASVLVGTAERNGVADFVEARLEPDDGSA